MTELENAIGDLKRSLQKNLMYGKKTQKEIIRLLPFIEKAQKIGELSDAVLLDIVLKTLKLLNFTPGILSKKGKKYVYILDESHYGYLSFDDRIRLERLYGIAAQRKPIEFSSQYSETHDEFEKLIDSVPGKRNERLTVLAGYVILIGIMVILIGGIYLLHPVLITGTLMMSLGFIAALYNYYVRTGFSKQLLNVSKARQYDEKNYLLTPCAQSCKHGENNLLLFSPKETNGMPTPMRKNTNDSSTFGSPFKISMSAKE